MIFFLLAIFVSINTSITAQDKPEDTRIPPEISDTHSSWVMTNKDYANTRAIIASSISTDNVNNLELAWTVSLDGYEHNLPVRNATPLVVDSTVYMQSGANNIYTLEIETGEIIWQKNYNADIALNGIGIGYGKVFALAEENTFFALDRATGDELWSQTLEETLNGITQPYVYDDTVYFASQMAVLGEDVQASPNYEAGTSGVIYALNQSDGNINWQFQVIDNAFWDSAEANSGGNVRFPPAVDRETGITYWGTGNTNPTLDSTVQYNDAARYANAIIALNNNGSLDWYNQINPDDIFELDVKISPIVANLMINGQQRNVVIIAGELGELIALDRETGDTIWRTLVGIHQNDTLTNLPNDLPITVYPGAYGGVPAPMAYHDGVVYAAVLNLPTTYIEGEIDNISTGEGTSEIVALDAKTGDIYWNHIINAEVYAGTTIVNDLVLTADYNGTIYAINRINGERMWTWQAPAGINAMPAVVDDTIIWEASVGDNPQLIALRLGAESAITDAEETPSVDATATAMTTITATIPNTEASQPTETTTQSVTATSPATATTASDTVNNQAVDRDVQAILNDLQDANGDAQRGERLFNASTPTQLDETINCASCHNDGIFGPDTSGMWQRIENQRLGLSQFSDYSAQQYAIESIVRPNAYVASSYDANVMPDNFGELMTTQDLADIIVYLQTTTSD